MNYSKEDFEILYKTNYRQMYRVAFLVLQDEEDARDAVSQVFAEMWHHKPPVDNEGVTAYLLISTRNCSLNMARDRRHHEVLSANVADDDPQQAEERNELMDELQRIIRQELSTQDRRILKLRYDADLSYAETARELGISTSAVNKHITRSFSKIRTLLSTKKK